MNINVSNASSLERTSRSAPYSSTRAGVSGKPQPSSDQIHLSSMSDSILTNGSASAEQSAHSAQVGQLVNSGRYEIDSNEVSASMIRHSMAVAA